MQTNKLPFVSIIIPVYNEEKYIGYCLESLKNLNYPDERYEIIIIDNGSTDATVSLCKRFTRKIYICADLNVSALRNFGSKKALGEIYAFIDADCVADKNWLQKAVEFLTKEPCIIGSKYNVPSDSTWIEKAWFSQRLPGRCETNYLNSGNMILPADLFNRIGGFDKTLISGEDYEFCMRAKRQTRIICDDTVEVVHLGNPKTIRQFIKREIWHGLGSISSLRHGWFDKPLIGTFAFSLLTLVQLLGFTQWIIDGRLALLAYSSVGIVILLLATIFYRINYISNLVQALQLFILYYLFYVGRSISLLYLTTKRKYTRVK